jgi:hypothetical protein
MAIALSDGSYILKQYNKFSNLKPKIFDVDSRTGKGKESGHKLTPTHREQHC